MWQCEGKTVCLCMPSGEYVQIRSSSTLINGMACMHVRIAGSDFRSWVAHVMLHACSILVPGPCQYAHCHA